MFQYTYFCWSPLPGCNNVAYCPLESTQLYFLTLVIFQTDHEIYCIVIEINCLTLMLRTPLGVCLSCVTQIVMMNEFQGLLAFPLCFFDVLHLYNIDSFDIMSYCSVVCVTLWEPIPSPSFHTFPQFDKWIADWK